MESLLPPSWYPELQVYERHVPTVTPPSRYRPLLITGRTSGHVACEGGAVSKITLINCLNGNGENHIPMKIQDEVGGLHWPLLEQVIEFDWPSSW